MDGILSILLACVALAVLIYGYKREDKKETSTIQGFRSLGWILLSFALIAAAYLIWHP